MKSIYMQLSMKVSYKLILWYLMWMVKYSQSSQNSKFAMSLQYLKKEFRDELDFLLADKHQSFLQVNFNTFCINVSDKVILSLLMGISKHSQSTQSSNFVIFLQYLKKEVGCWISKFLQVGIIIFDESGQTCPN